MYDDIVSMPVFDVSYVVDEEIWVQKNPKKGDHIRVKRLDGLYAHHGIYISDNEVIHFTGKDDDSVLDWSKPEVIQSDLKYFLKDGVLEVKEYTDDEFQDLYSPEQIVTYARACLGDKGYNLVFNNCEHFANVCTLGRFRSNQVERVLTGNMPNQEEKKMGIFSAIGGAIAGLFGGGSKSSGGGDRSTTNTTYEPDKVRAAQIESDTKIRLAGMEKERIELMKNARLDILECETESKIALEEARAKGFTVMAQTIVAMQEKLNEVAEKRLQIIEKGSLEVVKQIENFYLELEKNIEADANNYTKEKLPAILEILNQYEEGTPAHKLYCKRIESDMAFQLEVNQKQLQYIKERQNKVIESFDKSKERILEQTGNMTAGLLDAVQSQILSIESDIKTENGETSISSNLLGGKQNLQITDGTENEKSEQE